MRMRVHGTQTNNGSDFILFLCYRTNVKIEERKKYNLNEENRSDERKYTDKSKITDFQRCDFRSV